MSKLSNGNSNQGQPHVTGTVFVVDDDEQVRTSIEQLAGSIGLQVRTFASARDFLEECDASFAGCLVTDVRMPGMSGLELQQALREREITLPVIVMTGYAEVPMTVQAFKEGAIDFVQKPFDPQALSEIIQRALDEDAKQRQRSEQISEIAARIASLSPRELEVTRLLVDGKSTKAISKALRISLTTVDFHRNNLLDKMSVDNVVELTRAVDLFEFLQRRGE